MKKAIIQLPAADDKDVRDLKVLLDELDVMGQSVISKAMRGGELLKGLKSKLPHGSWLQFLEDDIGIKARTASNYIRLFENRDRLAKSANIADLGVTKALGTLKKGKAGAAGKRGRAFDPERSSVTAPPLPPLPPGGERARGDDPSDTSEYDAGAGGTSKIIDVEISTDGAAQIGSDRVEADAESWVELAARDSSAESEPDRVEKTEGECDDDHVHGLASTATASGELLDEELFEVNLLTKTMRIPIPKDAPLNQKKIQRGVTDLGKQWGEADPDEVETLQRLVVDCAVTANRLATEDPTIPRSKLQFAFRTLWDLLG